MKKQIRQHVLIQDFSELKIPDTLRKHYIIILLVLCYKVVTTLTTL